MKTKQRFILVLGLIYLYLVFLPIQTFSYSINEAPKASNGILDASSWRFSGNSGLKLDGQWEFYWNALLEPTSFNTGGYKSSFFDVPLYWNKLGGTSIYPFEGFATYRLKVITGGLNDSLAMNIPVIDSSYKIWVGDKLIFEQGKVGKNILNSAPRVKRSLAVFSQPSKEFYITIQVSNFTDTNGGIGQSITLGNSTAIIEDYEEGIIYSVFLFGLIIVMSIYHLILYLLRKRDVAYLMLAWLGFNIAMINLGKQNLAFILVPDSISFGPNSRIILFFIACVYPALTKFIHELFISESYSWLSKNINRITGINIVLAAIVTDSYMTIFTIYLTALAIIIVLILVLILIKSVAKKLEGSLIILNGFIFAIITGVNDLLYSQNIINTAFISSIGITCLIVSQTVLLAMKLTNSFNTIERFSEKLISLDKLKDEFLANTSHELRTPINGIIGLVESLIDGVAGKLPEIAILNLNLVASSAKRLSSLINDILDSSKIKNHDISIQKKPIDMRSITDLVLSFSQSLINGKNVKLLNEIPEETPLVLGDENRLQQILFNLVGNAIKFTEEGYVCVSATQKDNEVIIKIHDSGIGIDKKYIDTIFLSFEQIDSSSSREFSGTGLGLSITKHLVELHEGRIWVESRKGNGSTFYFSIPICSPEDAQKYNENSQSTGLFQEVLKDAEAAFLSINNGDVNAAPPNESNETSEEFEGGILIVDDEPINIQVLKNHLTLNRYHVITASNGIEALKIIEHSAHKINLVILDVMMPKMSGYEACKRIRQNHSIFELPVIMVTAKNQPHDAIEGLDCGANDYLSKPFSKKELLTRVKNLLALKFAVEHAILNRQQLESERKQRLLAENIRHVSSMLLSTLDLTEILHNLLESLETILDCDYSYIILKDSENITRSAVRDKKHLEKKILEVELDFIFEKVLHVDDTVILAGDDPLLEDISFIYNSQSWFGIPLVFNNELSGAMILENTREKEYNDFEVSIAKTFAEYASIAISKANLFSQVNVLATIDSLSGLYNRRYFFAISEKIFTDSTASGDSLSIIMMDIDYFKNINDTYGHDVGDEVIKFVGNNIRFFLRKTDVMGRYGGEEFAILLPDSDTKAAVEISERIRKYFSESFITDHEQKITFTVSIGVYTRDAETESLNAMLVNADKKMYEAKNDGRNKVKF